MNDKDNNERPTRGGLQALLKKKDLAKPVNSDWVRVGIIMHPDDLDMYRDFFWFLKNKSGNAMWGHKEVQHHLMELVHEKYGKIPKRTEAEREREAKNMKPKKKS